jgi:hypothetical protein
MSDYHLTVFVDDHTVGRSTQPVCIKDNIEVLVDLGELVGEVSGLEFKFTKEGVSVVATDDAGDSKNGQDNTIPYAELAKILVE